jgi:hypothetical protein
MRLAGLVAIYQRRNTSEPAPAHKIYPYLLGAISIERVNQVWCADVTHIPMAKGFLYLVVIMDWVSRAVPAWRLSNTLGAEFCVEALEEALALHGQPEISNTDQGSQFTSDDFTGTCGTTQSKTIMAWLLIEELLPRRSRTLLDRGTRQSGRAVAGRDGRKVRPRFRSADPRSGRTLASGNPFVERTRLIARLDMLARSDELRAKLEAAAGVLSGAVDVRSDLRRRLRASSPPHTGHRGVRAGLGAPPARHHGLHLPRAPRRGDLPV